MEEIAFREGESKDFEQLLKQTMEKPIKHFETELASIRTGRASTKLIEDLKVECYGQMMALKELATLSTPESRLLTIQPWDITSIPAIEKALQNSELGAAPVNDGALIRIQLPQMSSSRRDELIKLLGKKTEECRVSIRNHRKDFHNEIRDAEKKKIISKDFAKKLIEIMQKITDSFIEQTNKFHEKKAGELKHI